MQKAIHSRVVLLPLVRVKRCAVNCKDTIEWAVFSVHLLFRDRLLSLSLTDHIHPLPPLHAVRQLVCHHLIDESGSRRRKILISRTSGYANYQHQCDCESA
jgi:hypothetical protein